MDIEVVPAILRRSYEGMAEDWEKIYRVAHHIQLDITDGVFAGDGSFRDVRMFKHFPSHEKIELHMMVHKAASYVDDIIDLNPARCVFHIESFTGTSDIEFVYHKLRENTQTELALAITPESPNQRLEEHLSLVTYVLFMGYNPGWAGQAVNPMVFVKIGQFHEKYPHIPIAVDGHVDKQTIQDYVKAGARILCANSAIFREGNPVHNLHDLQLLATAALTS